MATSFSVEPNDRVTFSVRYEDDALLVVAKPPHVVTQPGLGHENDALLNGLFARHGQQLQQLGAARDFGLLHRLDRRASGLVIVALSAEAYDGLRAQFEARSVRKYYWALVRGRPRTDEGVITLRIAESTAREGTPTQRKSARVSGKGKESVTAFRVIAAARQASLLECRAVTGRMHQLRVHLEAIGCPILGDDEYAPPVVASMAPRLALHAHRVVFEHPSSGATIDVDSEWPADLRSTLRRFELANPREKNSGIDRTGEIENDRVGDEDSGVGQPPP